MYIYSTNTRFRYGSYLEISGPKCTKLWTYYLHPRWQHIPVCKFAKDPTHIIGTSLYTHIVNLAPIGMYKHKQMYRPHLLKVTIGLHMEVLELLAGLFFKFTYTRMLSS